MLLSKDVKILTDMNTPNNSDDCSINKQFTNSNFYNLRKIFNDCTHLNCQEIEFGNYIIYNRHTIDSGTFGNVFLGCDKEIGIYVAIKQFKTSLYDIFLLEKRILTNIRGTGNFPEFYDCIERDDGLYIIESFMDLL